MLAASVRYIRCLECDSQLAVSPDEPPATLTHYSDGSHIFTPGEVRAGLEVPGVPRRVPGGATPRQGVVTDLAGETSPAIEQHDPDNRDG